MKTMKSLKGKIVRVSDERASQLYQDGEATYATKEEWKNEVRDVKILKKPEGLTSKDKWNKPSKAQKRHMRKTL